MPVGPHVVLLRVILLVRRQVFEQVAPGLRDDVTTIAYPDNPRAVLSSILLTCFVRRLATLTSSASGSPERVTVSALSARLRHAVYPRHAELIALRHQTTKLAALVHHYYAAYREAQALLSRREQELAELRRRLDSKPVRIAG
jgi:hypothetical protein